MLDVDDCFATKSFKSSYLFEQHPALIHLAEDNMILSSAGIYAGPCLALKSLLNISTGYSNGFLRYCPCLYRIFPTFVS